MKNKYFVMLIVGLLIVLGFSTISMTAASATGDDYPYEVDVCWTMDNPDGVEGTYEFPQTRGCDTAPKCEGLVERQYDTYWIRDADDEAYLAGLTVLNSSADDAQLEPHDYYGELLENNTPCEPPVHVKRASFGVIPFCAGAYVQDRRGVDFIKHRTPNARKHVFVGHSKPDWLFNNGSRWMTKVVYEKRGGVCGGSSS